MHDAVGVRIEHAHEDVEVAVVVRSAELRLEARINVHLGLELPELRVPRRGDKKALLETVARNAGESLALHKTRRASDLTTRSKALNEIQESLGLDDAPLRIECYDVSNLQGTHVVASMVVFEDGLARKSEYRRFAIKGTDGTDDISSIHEVIARRFRRYLAEREKTGELDTLGDPEAGEGSDNEAERADVTAQLLRIRMYADWAGAAPLDREAARQEAERGGSCRRADGRSRR